VQECDEGEGIQERGKRVPFIDIEKPNRNDRSVSSIWTSLTFDSARRIIAAQFHKFLVLVFPNRRAPASEVASETSKKEYQAPIVRRLSSEQAKLLLLGHASIGDQGAKDLMNLVFPEPAMSKPTSDKSRAQSAS